MLLFGIEEKCYFREAASIFEKMKRQLPADGTPFSGWRGFFGGIVLYSCIEIEKTLEPLLRECGGIILSASHVKAAAKSGRRDLVTKYDKAVQEMLMERLSAEFPEAGFVCEEDNVREHLDSPLVFIVDPIDGTANFSKGLRYSCISVACLIDGVPSVGVVYNPYADEMFSAVLGEGARLNGEEIYVSGDTIADSIVIFGTSPYNAELTDLTFDRLRRVFNNCLDVRRTGSAALDLCYAACGRCGVFFEAVLALWDYAAGALIVKEAGGKCMTMDGEALDYKTVKTSMIAGSVRNVDELYKLFSE